MVPLATWSTMHWACVQTALNALYWPADGWVTTTWAEVKILPPPTGTSLAAPSVLPPAPAPADPPPPPEGGRGGGQPGRAVPRPRRPPRGVAERLGFLRHVFLRDRWALPT